MHAVEKLKHTAYKLTRPRQLVLEYLSKRRKPKSIRELVNGLRGQIDQATIYRTIELLTSLGIVYEDFLLDERRFYVADRPHHHIICRRCHRVECLPCHVEYPTPKNFTGVTHALSLTGLCSTCA